MTQQPWLRMNQSQSEVNVTKAWNQLQSPLSVVSQELDVPPASSPALLGQCRGWYLTLPKLPSGSWWKTASLEAHSLTRMIRRTNKSWLNDKQMMGWVSCVSHSSMVDLSAGVYLRCYRRVRRHRRWFGAPTCVSEQIYTITVCTPFIQTQNSLSRSQ